MKVGFVSDGNVITGMPTEISLAEGLLYRLLGGRDIWLKVKADLTLNLSNGATVMPSSMSVIPLPKETIVHLIQD